MPERRPRHALVVDDNPHARTVLARLLSALGLEVSEAESGEAALALASTHSFDLVLMDIEMPGMGGIAAADQLCLRVPLVIGVTGHDTAAVKGPFAAVLMKPVGVEALASTLKRILAA